MKIAIDPGHGAYPDTGAEGYLNEQDSALAIGNAVVSKLKELGHEAWIVRPSSASSVTDSLQKRCDAANGADYLVSIHLNAGGGNGSEVFAMSQAGYNLAQKVQDELVNLGFTNRGVKDGSGLYVIKNSNPVAILVEVCFVDSLSDYNLYNSLGVSRIANGLVKGITGQSIIEEELYMNKIVVYLGDADVFAAILVSQKNGCALMKKSDFEATQIKVDEVIQIGGKPNSDRYTTFKDAAALV